MQTLRGVAPPRDPFNSPARYFATKRQHERVLEAGSGTSIVHVPLVPARRTRKPPVTAATNFPLPSTVPATDSSIIDG